MGAQDAIRLVTTAYGRHIHAVAGTGHSTTLCGRQSVQTAHAVNATCKVCSRAVAALREPITVYGCASDGCQRPADKGSTMCDQHTAEYETGTADPMDASGAVDATDAAHVLGLARPDMWCDGADDLGGLCGNRADVDTAHGPLCAPHAALAALDSGARWEVWARGTDGRDVACGLEFATREAAACKADSLTRTDAAAPAPLVYYVREGMPCAR